MAMKGSITLTRIRTSLLSNFLGVYAPKNIVTVSNNHPNAVKYSPMFKKYKNSTKNRHPIIKLILSFRFIY